MYEKDLNDFFSHRQFSNTSNQASLSLTSTYCKIFYNIAKIPFSAFVIYLLKKDFDRFVIKVSANFSCLNILLFDSSFKNICKQLLLYISIELVKHVNSARSSVFKILKIMKINRHIYNFFKFVCM
jgi:hypothetical protein